MNTPLQSYGDRMKDPFARIKKAGRIAQAYKDACRKRGVYKAVVGMGPIDKILEILDIMDISPEDWVRIQFEELPVEDCLRLFNLTYPPIGVLATAGAVDRVVKLIGRNNSLDVVDSNRLREKAINSSEEFVRNVIAIPADLNVPTWDDMVDDAFLQHIAIHFNSGDISAHWVVSRSASWLKEFSKYFEALTNEALDNLDSAMEAKYGVERN